MPDTVESYAPGPGSPLRSAPPTRGDLPMEYDGARSFLLSATVCGSYCEEPEPHSTRSGCTHVDVAGWTHAGGGGNDMGHRPQEVLPPATTCMQALLTTGPGVSEPCHASLALLENTATGADCDTFVQETRTCPVGSHMLGQHVSTTLSSTSARHTHSPVHQTNLALRVRLLPDATPAIIGTRSWAVAACR